PSQCQPASGWAVAVRPRPEAARAAAVAAAVWGGVSARTADDRAWPTSGRAAALPTDWRAWGGADRAAARGRAGFRPRFRPRHTTTPRWQSRYWSASRS